MVEGGRRMVRGLGDRGLGFGDWGGEVREVLVGEVRLLGSLGGRQC